MEQQPHSAFALDEYADSLANLARISFHGRDVESCLRLGKVSVDYRRKAAAAEPQTPGYTKSLGQGLSTLCVDMIEFGRYRESLDVCRESDRVLSSVRDFARVRRVVQRLLANNAEHEGRACAGLREDARTIAQFRSAIRQLRDMRADVPADTVNLRHLASCLSRLAEVQFRMRQAPPARVAAEEALQMAREASAADPSNARERLALDEIRERGRPVVQGGNGAADGRQE